MIAALLLAALDVPANDGWTIEPVAERCWASHPFGGAVPGVFRILSRTSTDFDSVINVDLPNGLPEWQALMPALRLSPNGRIVSPYGGVTTMPDGGFKVGMPLNKTETDSLAASTAVVLQLGETTTVPINTGPLRTVMRDLKKCGDDILRGWGVDPSRVAKSPPGGPGAWFKGSDYPADAKRAGSQGRVMFVAEVRRDGTITTCKIVTSSGSASLDARTCEIVQSRGRYGRVSDSAPRWGIGVVRWSLADVP